MPGLDAFTSRQTSLTMHEHANEATVVVAGSGRLPAIVLSALKGTAADVRILALPDFDHGAVPELSADSVSLENFADWLTRLKSEGYSKIVFAGGARRPRIASETEISNHKNVVLPNLFAGDDSVIRSIVKLVERHGFLVTGAHEIAPELISAPGILTKKTPGAEDRLDVARAAEIVRAVGAADVGQAAVVVCRLCIALETVTGTAAMLETAARSISTFNPRPNVVCGVMYKAPKPGQEMRLDMPAIGPETVRQAAAAGLSGIAIEAGSVMILDCLETVQAADDADLFIWSRPAD